MINDWFAAIEKLIPHYMNNSIDANIANGNVAMCLIVGNGVVHGRMFGTDKPRMR